MNTKQKKIDIVKKWIAALRSGEYKQGKAALIQTSDSGPRYCCLGVLCDVAKEQFKLTMHKDGVGTPDGGYWEAYLPSPIVVYLALDTDHLIDMNDNFNNRFKTIANYIEKNILPRLEE